MKFLQKILSHGLLITFFVAVFFLYLYRVELFPQWFAEPTPTVAMQSDLTADEQAVTGAEQPAPEPTPAAPDVAVTQTAELTVPAPEQEIVALPPLEEEVEPAAEPAMPEPAGAPTDMAPAVAQEAPAVTAAEPLPAEEPAEAPVQQPAEQRAAEAPADVEPAPEYRPEQPPKTFPPLVTYTPAPAEEPAQQPVEQPPAPQYRPEQAPKIYPPRETPMARPTTVSQPAVPVVPETGAPSEVPDYQAQLASARNLYWRGDAEGAVPVYESLTASHPDRADAWGELGNLYFKLERWSAAADAYYRAIELLIDQGDARRAHQMLRVLYGLDSGKASELEKRLRRVTG